MCRIILFWGYCVDWFLYILSGRISESRNLLLIKNQFKRILVGGALLGLLIYIFPPLYGEGYSSLEALLTDNADAIVEQYLFFRFPNYAFVVVLYVIGLVFIKVVATAFTNGSGGLEVFSPQFVHWGVTGFLIAYLINMTGVITVPVSYFVLAGMAGVMSGVMNSPLTAMFLIAEITSGYSLLVPLMITSVTAHLTGRGMEPYSIYARRLAMKGDLITHNKDKAVLTLMKLNKVIETDLQTISIEATLGIW